MGSPFITGGISILPPRTKLYHCSACYIINEEFRLRICSVLSGVIGDEHLMHLRTGIRLPLLLIILHIYIDFTGGLDSEAISFLHEATLVRYGQTIPTPGSPEDVILSQLFYSADHASRFCLLRLDDDDQSSCSSRIGAWVQFYFFQLLEPTEARLWLRHQNSLITIDLLTEELSDILSRLWFPGDGVWGTSTWIRKDIKCRAEIWSQDNCIGLKRVPVESYDLTPYRIKLDTIGL